MLTRQLRISILALAALSVLSGLLYPLAVTAMAQLCFRHKANGSILLCGGRAAGSELVGQSFDEPRYFWGRLSATQPPFNAASSAGSNYGPLNPALLRTTQARIDALRKADPGNGGPIPADLVTSSASGIDPHISPAAAYYQARRVARLRGIPEQDMQRLIARYTQGHFLGIFGEPRVNVLKLNIALAAGR